MSENSSNKILLVGNPNVGKSVIFSFLTGRYAVVSNYPGTTVEIAHGRATFDRDMEVIDTPGINSLFPGSEDERVTRDLILRYSDATIIQVADAKDIFRALLLTSQLAELKRNVILVLNMMDEARQRGIVIDRETLSRVVGVKVIEAVAIEKVGLPAVISAIQNGEASVPVMKIEYPEYIRKAIGRYGRELIKVNRYDLFGILTFLSGDDRFFLDPSGKRPSSLSRALEMIREDEKRMSTPYSYTIAEARKDLVSRIVSAVERKYVERMSEKPPLSRLINLPTVIVLAVTAALYFIFGRVRMGEMGLHPTMALLSILAVIASLAGVKRLNEFTLNPVGGVISLAAVLYIVYKLVGVFGAQIVVDFMENTVFNAHIVPVLSKVLKDGFLRDFLIGDYGLISMGLNYSLSIVLPIVTVFFLVFGVLEDSGYFPRITVLSHRAFRVVGLTGKATLPIILGFGCVTMASLASRIMDTNSDGRLQKTVPVICPCFESAGSFLQDSF